MCIEARAKLSQTMRSVESSDAPISVSGKVNADQVSNLLKQVQVGNKDKVIMAIRDMTNLNMSETRELVDAFFTDHGSFINA